MFDGGPRRRAPGSVVDGAGTAVGTAGGGSKCNEFPSARSSLALQCPMKTRHPDPRREAPPVQDRTVETPTSPV